MDCPRVNAVKEIVGHEQVGEAIFLGFHVDTFRSSLFHDLGGATILHFISYYKLLYSSCLNITKYCPDFYFMLAPIRDCQVHIIVKRDSITYVLFKIERGGRLVSWSTPSQHSFMLNVDC